MFARLFRFSKRFGSSPFKTFMVASKERNVRTVLISSYALTGFMVKALEPALKEPITIIEPSEFTHTFQIRQAANSSVDSSIKLLSCCIQVLHTGYTEYTALLNGGIMWLSMAIETNALTTGNTVIEDELLRVRSELSSLKSRISEMLFVYEEIRNLLNTAIGISFLVGNEEASGLASSYLYNCQQEVNFKKLSINGHTFFICFHNRLIN